MITSFYDAFPQFLDENGDVFRGRIQFFSGSATTTYKTIYSDSTYTTTASNPIALDSTGKTASQVFLYDGLYYVVVQRFTGADTDTMAAHWDASVDSNYASYWETYKEFLIDSTTPASTTTAIPTITVATIAALRGVDTTEYQSAIVMGYYELGDCQPRIYYWDEGNTGTENYGTIIKSNAETSDGMWLYKEEPILDAAVFGVISGTTATELSNKLGELATWSSGTNCHATSISFAKGTYTLTKNTSYSFGRLVHLDAKGVLFAIDGSDTTANLTLIFNAGLEYKGSTVIENDSRIYAYPTVGTLKTSWWTNIVSFEKSILSSNLNIIVDNSDLIFDKDVTFTNDAIRFIEPFSINQTNAIAYDNCTFIGIMFSESIPSAVTFTDCGTLRLSSLGIIDTVLSPTIANSSGTHFILDCNLELTADLDDTDNNYIYITKTGTIDAKDYIFTTAQADGFGQGAFTGDVRYGATNFVYAPYYTAIADVFTVASALSLGINLGSTTWALAQNETFDGIIESGTLTMGEYTLTNTSTSTTTLISVIATLTVIADSSIIIEGGTVTILPATTGITIKSLEILSGASVTLTRTEAITNVTTLIVTSSNFAISDNYLFQCTTLTASAANITANSYFNVTSTSIETALQNSSITLSGIAVNFGVTYDIEANACTFSDCLVKAPQGSLVLCQAIGFEQMTGGGYMRILNCNFVNASYKGIELGQGDVINCYLPTGAISYKTALAGSKDESVSSNTYTFENCITGVCSGNTATEVDIVGETSTVTQANRKYCVIGLIIKNNILSTAEGVVSSGYFDYRPVPTLHSQTKQCNRMTIIDNFTLDGYNTKSTHVILNEAIDQDSVSSLQESPIFVLANDSTALVDTYGTLTRFQIFRSHLTNSHDIGKYYYVTGPGYEIISYGPGLITDNNDADNLTVTGRRYN